MSEDQEIRKLTHSCARTTGTDVPCYEVSAADSGPGPSLGNGRCWITIGSDGSLRTLFSTDVGEEVAGPLIVRYAGAEARVAECSGIACGLHANVPLSAVGSGTFTIHPAFHRHNFDLPDEIAVQETVFIPSASDTKRDRAAAYHLIDVHNESSRSRELRVYGFLRFAGSRRRAVIHAEYDGECNAIFATEEENPDWTRVLCATVKPTSFSVTDDFGGIFDSDVILPLGDNPSGAGDMLGCLELSVHLEPHERHRMAFIVAFNPKGREAARGELDELMDVDAILESTIQHVQEKAEVCHVMTPEPVINEGAYWSKVNMLRVLAHYPQGQSFTNEPGASSNVVARDAVWFVYGCDHFAPEASRHILDALQRFQYEDGKIPEYYNARTGEVADYGLNINDGTPLYVLGVNHHVRSTGDLEYLRKMYDSVSRACRYILSQRDERGLVYCSGEGVEVWGICSWRNVIPNYQINGAVTEINAECAAALRAMGHMAENIGKKGDAEEFGSAARELTDAINEHLLDKEKQLYILNIDTNGVRHTDVTADEVFPVLFRVADENVAFRIIRRLNSPDFWTPAGLRTASRLDPLYDPARYVGLIGGVWPGLTWWYAFAAKRYHPEFMVKALSAAYAHYNRNPRVFNTVPGQFSEWFDGESLVNRGMRLSPWEPPRFLWAAVEGVCGMMLSTGDPGIKPLIPSDWQWVGAVGVRYHGKPVTFFAARMDDGMHVFANTDFKGAGAKRVLEEDITAGVRVGHKWVHRIALQDEGRVIVALGSSHDESMTTPVDLSHVLKPDTRYNLMQFSSERGRWTEMESGWGRGYANLAVRIEAKGYHLLEFTRS